MTGKFKLVKRAALCAILIGAFAVRSAQAGESVWTTYETPDAFLAEAFGSAPPAAQMLELDAGKQSQVAAVFGRPYPQSRLRYWRAGGRSAWILDDLGKQGYQLTTAGFVVKGGEIDFARVLIYRESRGEQVADPSFLKKLSGLRPNGNGLNREVDGISGATLSVKMMQRMARTALTLDSIAP